MDVPSAERLGGFASRPRPAASEWIALGGVGAALGAVALSPRGIEDGPVVCPFRLLTGLPCPGCGLSRAWVYLAHGQWQDSVLANPFGVVLAALLVTLVVGVVGARVRRDVPPDLDRLVRRRWVGVILGAWLAFALVRLLVALG
jgi:hypothetical protein